MSTNKLKLNPDKTGFLPIGIERQRSIYLSMFPIELLGVKTNPAKSACNLGVIFDKNFTFRSQISVVCNSCFYHMRDLRRIRRHLDLDSAKLLATTLVSSRLDCCSSLLYGIADIDLTRLQRVQNQLARLVTKSPPFTRSVPLLRSLHWFPVRLRILCKINLLTYHHSLGPHLYVNGHQISYSSMGKNSWWCTGKDKHYSLLPVHWDQTMIIVCQSLGSRPIIVPELFTLVPHLFGTTSCCLSVQPVQLLPSRNLWRHISLIWPFPHRYRHSPWPVDVTEVFINFAVEHWFGCRATEPGFAGDIGAIEVSLIDWLI